MADRLVLEVSALGALAGSFVLSFIFVASLYAWKLVGYKDTNRDETGTIQRRFLSAFVSCLCSAALVLSWSRPAELERAATKTFTAWELLGLQLEGSLGSCLACLALTAILFLGPLVQHGVAVVECGVPLVSVPDGPWVALRNDVLAPFTEEFVFRACLVRLWLAAGFSGVLTISCSPLCFALAHTHHYVEHVRRLKHRQLALMQVGFQVFYTSLFAIYSNFLLLRTGSTLAVVLVHSFCNHQGFPDLGFLGSAAHPLGHRRGLLGAAYLVGICLFFGCMFPLTEGFRSSFEPTAVSGQAA